MRRLPQALIPVLLWVLTAGPVFSETPAAPVPAVPSVDQIVERMQQHEAWQLKRLQQYEAMRRYQVQYKGFKLNIAASMDVAVTYDAAAGKSFRIISQKGSKLLCDKVLRRAVESEKEASQERQSTALNPANYRFQLTGTELLDGRPTYVLRVDPLREGKFLYRGSVWVDAADYTVDKIEVQPAKNPSFWIAGTEIQNTNSDIHGITLPQKNRSESRIRIGGTAVLTIDYGTYHVLLKGQPQSEAHVPRRSTLTEAASEQQR